MLKKVDDFIRHNDLLERGSNVVVGVSGGPDSIALLHYFLSISNRWDLSIIVAHVNHMFRGKESEEDYSFVQRVCKTHNVPFEGEHINVTTYQRENNLSPQIAARECRYKFFRNVMDKYHASFLALGHHGDDQIETLMMRMTRGSYVTGLAGIPAKRPFGQGSIIRPFLVLSKEDIMLYCERKQLISRVDESNSSVKYTRNRIRHTLLPLIKEENPKAHERFQFISEILREDDGYLNKLAEDRMKSVILEKHKSSILLSIQELVESPISLQRRGIHLILKYLYGDHLSSLSSIHIENLLRFLKSSHPSGQLTFPFGLHIEKSYDKCFLTFSEKYLEEDVSFELILHVPGVVKIDGEFSISASWTASSSIKEETNVEFVVDPSKISLPLIVRTRKAGDRIQLANGTGRKKMKDLFIDEKIPIKNRNSWPIVTDYFQNVIWVPKLKKAPYAPGNNVDGNVILLTYTPH